MAAPGGFSTTQLRITIDPQLRLTIPNLVDNILQKDAAPVTWDGPRFTVSKQNTDADHFFGLGDKKRGRRT